MIDRCGERVWAVSKPIHLEPTYLTGPFIPDENVEPSVRHVAVQAAQLAPPARLNFSHRHNLSTALNRAPLRRVRPMLWREQFFAYSTLTRPDALWLVLGPLVGERLWCDGLPSPILLPALVAAELNKHANNSAY